MISTSMILVKWALDMVAKVTYVLSSDGKSLVKTLLGDRSWDKEGNKMSGDSSPTLEDVMTIKRAIHPMWTFSDVNMCRWCKRQYWAFVGCHYPAGLQSLEEDAYKAALKSLEDGSYIRKQQEIYGSAKRIGWGNGENPSDAFRIALRMAGHLGPIKES